MLLIRTHRPGRGFVMALIFLLYSRDRERTVIIRIKGGGLSATRMTLGIRLGTIRVRMLTRAIQVIPAVRCADGRVLVAVSVGDRLHGIGKERSGGERQDIQRKESDRADNE